MSYKLVRFKNLAPEIRKSVFLADGAVIAGDVTIEDNASIWFNSVIRGDVAPVTIGKNTNIQDGSVVHTSRFDGPTHIGSNITIGHMALLHACIIEDNAFIGSRCIVVEGVRVESEAVLGANVVLTASTKIIDVTGENPIEHKGFIPSRSVVIPGSYSKSFPSGNYNVPCALIIGKRKESTDKKTSLNEALRTHDVAV